MTVGATMAWFTCGCGVTSSGSCADNSTCPSQGDGGASVLDASMLTQDAGVESSAMVRDSGSSASGDGSSRVDGGCVASSEPK
ncbi:MAG: hypothetical protein ACREJ3_11870, partial [Polyangiaceae bacterium]